MAAPLYTYMVHDLLTNAPLAELPLSNVEYSKRLNDSGSARGTFGVESRTNPFRKVRDPYDLTMPGRRCLYVYRDDTPMWGGIIWTRRYNSTSRTVEVGCGDWWTYFDHRKVVPLLTFPVAPAYDIAELRLTFGGDQNDIARGLIQVAQAHTGGDLGIIGDTSLSLIDRTRQYAGYELSWVGEALRQLAAVEGGADMMFDTGGPDVNGRPTRLFRQGTPYLGQQGSPWVFEFGANLIDYTWPSDATRYASRGFATGEGSDDGTLIAAAEDTSRYAGGFPLIESETAYTTVSNVDTLQQHADADLFASRLPVVLPELEVRGDRSPIVGEWGLGDDAHVIIEDDFVPTGIDTSLRIIGMSISPGEDRETVRVTCGPLLDDVA
ncbi:hypothetical protein [Amycolatopsis sp. cmx-11-32]|uniref:hypothetical protein n=1 Tax=Amycolatopsis sp. cmx-11-32 TaxID=2785796 RepID=UPI0039E2F315